MSKKFSTATARAAMLDKLTALAARVGATVEQDSAPRRSTVWLYLNGAGCMILVNGDEPAGLPYMAHWHFRRTTDRAGRLFCRGFDGHGYRPHHKATTMSDDLPGFLSAIEARFGWIADGTAFTTEEAA